VEGKVTNVWGKKRFELLYADGDYVDQDYEELYLRYPPETKSALSLK